MDRFTKWLRSEPVRSVTGMYGRATSVVQVSDIEHFSEFKKEYLHEVQVLASIEAPPVTGIQHLADFKKVFVSIEALD